MIESSSNAQIKKIQRLLKNARFRKQEQSFVVEGWKMVEEALEHGLVRGLYFSEEAEGQAKQMLPGLSTPYETVSDGLFRYLSDTVNPQGVLAIVDMPEYRWEDLAGSADAALLCLEDIQDPGNLGTMVRTAEAAGMTGLVLSRGCVDIFNPKVVRASMGAVFRVKFVQTELSTKVESMKKEGFSIYAAVLDGERLFTDEEYSGRVGILVGNEANGLSDSLRTLADRSVKIPMEGRTESLNAAVSAALLMYELHRKR